MSRHRTSLNEMPRPHFTTKDVDYYLYGQTAVLPVSIEGGNAGKQQEEAYQNILCHSNKSVDILQLRYKLGVEKEFSCTEEFNKVMTMLKTIPPQLHLCYSSIPGAGFGICAKQIIPSGTWIGPYEGKRLSQEEIKFMEDTRQVWEIYKNGVTDHYINGADRGHSSWMKYIQCARNTNEQNTVVFQFGADIYFQTYKKIEVGEELFVWYAEYYEQYLGIPVGVRKTAKTKIMGSAEAGNKSNEIPADAQSDIQENPRKSLEKSLPHLSRELFKAPSSSISSTVNFTKVLSPERWPKTSTEETIPSKIRIDYPQPIITSTVSMKKYEVKQPDAIVQQNHSPIIKSLPKRFWKCEHCLVKFPQKWALQVHSCPCDLTKPYKCSHCSKTFINKEDLQAHATNCGSGRVYKCGYCGRSFEGVNTLTRHLKVHSRPKMADGKKRRGRISNYEKYIQQKQLQ